MTRVLLPAMVGAFLLSAASGQAQTGPDTYGTGMNGIGGTHASPMTASPNRATVDGPSAVDPQPASPQATPSGSSLSEIPGTESRRDAPNADPITSLPRLDDFPNGR